MSEIPFLDKNEEISSTNGNLPHWYQSGKLQFVTFRLSDSLPQDRLDEIKSVIETFKELNKEPWSAEVKYRFRKLVGKTEEDLLDNGFGNCIFKDAEIRKILKETIFYRDGIDYEIIAYVIMPNHVHALIIPIAQKTISQILHSIKRFSAIKINKLINSSGQLWMRESYDRIVRSEDDLKHYLKYIINNPRHLKNEDYELYVR